MQTNDPMNKTKTETAVDKAQEAAGQAQRKVSETAEAAKEQAKRTVAQVSDQAKTTVDSRLGDVAQELGSVAEAVRSTTTELEGQDQQMIAQYGNRIADQIDQVSSYLNNHGVEDMLADAENLARRQPALFLGGAFMLGLVVGRFLRSSGPGGYRSYSGGGFDGGSGYGSGYNETSYSGGTGASYQGGAQTRRYERQSGSTSGSGRPAVEYGAETGARESHYQQGPSVYHTSNQKEFGENPTAYPTGLAEEGE
ncbi:hypothetical protein [Promineifilum sp.]|uniref:hypothetical protein n=1 Tax=Promineifilum sp. TaxID=2664178 RepID=UPI0035AEADF8